MGCKSLANKADCTTGSGAIVLQTYAALIMPDIGNATGASLTLSNGLRLSNLSADQAVATDSSKNLVSIPNTGTGNNVLQVSPTFNTSITTPLINFGSFPFTYSRGVWTPVMRTLRKIGLFVTGLEVRDWATNEGPVEILTNNGYYTKIGGQVTVFYEVATRFWGNGNDSLTYRTPIIQGLPFKCSTSGTPINVRMTGAMDDAGFPNGYALGLPVPLAVTMDGGFTSTVLEEGYVFETATPPFYGNGETWTADGYTMTTNCAQSQFTLIEGLAWSGLPGNLYNANILAGSQYTAKFVGSVTYFTDE
jgi:hypothetical protein